MQSDVSVMHEQLGSKSGLKRMGRPRDSAADPASCGTMTNSSHTQNSDDQTTREQFLNKFDDDDRRRTAAARTSVLQTTFSELSQEDWGGSR